MINDLPCRRCGVDMTPREARLGSDYCYVCAARYAPATELRRSLNEAIIDMGSEDME
jgi:uncharacterized protein (DUF2461 family)